MPHNGGRFYLLQAAERQSWRFDGNWFDNNTGAMFVSDVVFDIKPGRLAFITLEGEGAQVPADGELDLSPAFFDAYNNQLETIALNWSLDGNDITLEMLLNQGRWVATSVGGHELRVNADGVFATVRFTVVLEVRMHWPHLTTRKCLCKPVNRLTCLSKPWMFTGTLRLQPTSQRI